MTGFWVVMAAICFLLALGPATPLFQLAFDLIPGMHLFRIPVRWLYPFSLALAALAGMGADVVLGWVQSLPRAPRLGAGLIAVLLLAGGILIWRAGSPFAVFHAWEHHQALWVASAIGGLLALATPAVALMGGPSSRRWLSYGLAAAVAVELVAGSQWVVENHAATVDTYRTVSPIAAYVAAHPDGRVLSVAQGDWNTSPDRLAADTVIYVNASSVSGYSTPWPFSRDIALDSRVVAPLVAGAPVTPGVEELWRALGVAYIDAAVSQHNLAGVTGLRPVVASGPWVLYALDVPGSRTWASCGARIVPSSARALGAVLAPTFSTSTLYLEGAGPSVAGTVCGQSRIIRAGTTEVTIQARLPARGWVVLADSWYPGWVVDVDGHPAPMLHADYFLRAVSVPAGIHTLTFTYRPRSMYAGALVSLVSLLVLLAALGSLFWSSRVGRGRGYAVPDPDRPPPPAQ